MKMKKPLFYSPLISGFKLHKLKIIVLSVMVLFCMSFTMILHEYYPDPSNTGSPFDGQDCTSCHGDYTVNTGIGTASITTTVPIAGYIPGNTYSITAIVNYTGRSSFGFSLSPHSAAGVPYGNLIDNA